MWRSTFVGPAGANFGLRSTRTVRCLRPKSSHQSSGDVLAVEHWSTSQTNALRLRGVLGVASSQQHSEMVGEESVHWVPHLSRRAWGLHETWDDSFRKDLLLANPPQPALSEACWTPSAA